MMVSRINRISSAIFCNTFDMSVTCSFIGMKVQNLSEIRKRIWLFSTVLGDNRIEFLFDLLKIDENRC